MPPYEPKAIRLTRRISIVLILGSIGFAFFFPQKWMPRIFGLRLTPFDLLLLAIPATALLLVYEIVRAVSAAGGRRRFGIAKDRRFPRKPPPPGFQNPPHR